MPEEMLLVVDDSDNIKGYATRAGCHTGNGRHHRAFVLLLYNKEKKILIQKRKSKLWDGFWDITGASHVLHVNGRNESYEEAAERCAKNEWGTSARMKKILAFNYFERFDGKCENEYCALIAGQIKGKIKPDKNHVHDHRWVILKDLVDDMDKNPDKYVPWAKVAVDRLLESKEAKKFA